MQNILLNILRHLVALFYQKVEFITLILVCITYLLNRLHFLMWHL